MFALRHFRISKLLVLFIVLLSVLVCPKTDTFAENSKELKSLIEGAKKEGQLMFYASGNTGQLQLQLKRFREKYPFIKTSFFRTGKIKLLTRILSEHRFNKYMADVVQMSSIQANILKKNGAIEKYFPPESRFLSEESRDLQGYLHRVYISSIVCGYNKRLVAESEIPKTYEDLLDPKWKGNMAIETNKIEWFATVLRLKGEEFFEKLGQQRPSLRVGDTLSRQLLAAGEFKIVADTYLYGTEEFKLKGAPVDWIGLQPVIFYFATISLPVNAPHPNAGKLFINFMLTKDGQKAVNEWGRIPVRSDVGSKYKELLDRNKTILTDFEVGERSKEINNLIQKYLR